MWFSGLARVGVLRPIRVGDPCYVTGVRDELASDVAEVVASDAHYGLPNSSEDGQLYDQNDFIKKGAY